jgi:predicted transcriptional regulator
MKVKTIHIEVKSLDSALKEAGEVFEKLAQGKTVKKKDAIYFSNLKEMRRALTEKRLELLHIVKKQKPSSVYELSKMLHRDLKNVLQDVEYLRELGVLEVEETNDRKIPRVEYDKIALEVAV